MGSVCKNEMMKTKTLKNRININSQNKKLLFFLFIPFLYNTFFLRIKI